jgi:hypothetical protein
MAMTWSPRCYQSSAKVFAFVILFFGNVAITPAAEPSSTGSDQQQPGYTDDIEPGYPEEERSAGVIGDTEEDLDESFPQPGSLLPGFTAPRSWGIWQAKRDLYDQVCLKLGFSYQMPYQRASTTAPTWFTFDGKSVPYPGAPVRVGSSGPAILEVKGRVWFESEGGVCLRPR